MSPEDAEETLAHFDRDFLRSKYSIKFDANTREHKLLHWFVVQASTHLEREVFEEAIENAGSNGHTVLLTFNGVPLDIEKVFDDIQSHMDRMIQEKAEDLIREKFEKSWDEIQDHMDTIQDGLLKKVRELSFDKD